MSMKSLPSFAWNRIDSQWKYYLSFLGQKCWDQGPWVQRKELDLRGSKYSVQVVGEDLKGGSEDRQADSEYWKDSSEWQLVQSAQGEVYRRERYWLISMM